MSLSNKVLFFAKIILTLGLIMHSTFLLADPPTRVVRLSLVDGEVSFLPAGENTWVRALINRPFFIGDSLWNDVNSFSLLQLDNGRICLGSDTNVKIVNQDDYITQFQLNQGTMNIYVKGIKKDQEIEIDTPNLAYVIQSPGYYRVEVNNDGSATTVTVRKGQGIAYGENASYYIDENHSIQFRGTNLSDFRSYVPPAMDALEKWCNQHLIPKETVALQYVAEDVVGYEDLDQYGDWYEVGDYGYAWSPREVEVGWAPYRHGRWIWLELWGWTWVGDEAWGFAPYHYGRWVIYERRWYWIPGPRRARAVYAPALVVFVSTRKRQIAWFPLGPGDIYRPAYQVSQNYYFDLNMGNTIVTKSLLERSYRNPRERIRYRYRDEFNSITAVSTNTFVQARPVEKSLVKITKEQVINAPVTTSIEISPEAQSVLGAQPAPKIKPSEKVIERTAIGVSAIPPNKKLEDETEVQKTQVKIIEPQEPTKLPEAKPIEQQNEQKPEQQKATEQEQQQKAAEDAKRKAEHEADQQKAIEQEQQQKAAEDAKRKAEHEADQQKAIEQEQQQKAAEQAAQQKAAEEARQRAEQEAEQRAAEQKAAEQEAQQKAAEQEAQQKAAEQAAQQKAAEEARQRAEQEAEQRAAEQKAAEQAAQQKAAEEARQRAEQEALQRAEQQRAAEQAAQQKAAEEARQRAEQEAEQRAAEQRALQERVEQERAQQEAAQRAAQEKAAEQAAQQKAAEEAQLKAAQEQQEAEEAKRKAAEQKGNQPGQP